MLIDIHVHTTNIAGDGLRRPGGSRFPNPSELLAMMDAAGLGRAWGEDEAMTGMDPGEVPGPVWQSADHVARAGLDGAQAGKLVVIPGTHNKLAAGIGRLLPGWLLTKVTGVGRKATSRR